MSVVDETLTNIWLVTSVYVVALVCTGAQEQALHAPPQIPHCSPL